AMSEFADADVVINDWSVLDGESTGAPYVIVSDADSFRANLNTTASKGGTWDEVVTLCEWFTDWPTTLNNFRTRRQAIIDAARLTNSGSAGGIAGTSINEIRSEGGIIPYNPIYNRDGYNSEVLPRYLIQHMIFACEEF
ncbi:MAG TPA: hypothetical protein VII92_15330, partial [Anaerolineae bacterium]